jgi:hypothetical protein
MAFDLPARDQQRSAIEEKKTVSSNEETEDSAEDTRTLRLADLPGKHAAQQDQAREKEDDQNAGASLEVPPVVYRKENMQKEQIFVSKGQVITHYEDDMDVPTFLRKQMQ